MDLSLLHANSQESVLKNKQCYCSSTNVNFISLLDEIKRPVLHLRQNIHVIILFHLQRLGLFGINLIFILTTSFFDFDLGPGTLLVKSFDVC